MRIRLVLSVEVDEVSWAIDRGLVRREVRGLGSRALYPIERQEVRADVIEELTGQCLVFLERTGLGSVIERRASLTPRQVGR